MTAKVSLRGLSGDLYVSASALRRRMAYVSLKLRAMQLVSGLEKPVCKTCGIDDIDMLTFDHVYNDGAEDRRKYSGLSWLRAILNGRVPKDRLQVLCANHNMKRMVEARANQELRTRSFETTLTEAKMRSVAHLKPTEAAVALGVSASTYFKYKALYGVESA